MLGKGLGSHIRMHPRCSKTMRQHRLHGGCVCAQRCPEVGTSRDQVANQRGQQQQLTPGAVLSCRHCYAARDIKFKNSFLMLSLLSSLLRQDLVVMSSTISSKERTSTLFYSFRIVKFIVFTV